MKKRIHLISNVVLAVMVFSIWILSFFFWRGDSELSVNGWSDLKYFTVLSNLFVGVVAIIWLVMYAWKRKVPTWLSVLKYTAAASVFVTFTVVVVFLGPLYGYGRMYRGANLFFHLIVPVYSVAETVLFEEEISFKQSFFAMVPPCIYGIGYVTNCLVNGIGEWPNRNDWYSFLEWGYGVGVVVFIVICAVAWGLGLAVRALNKKALTINWRD